MSPYKRIGNKVYKKVDGKWVVKGKSKNAGKARKYLNVLQMVEHGGKPTGKTVRVRKKK